MANLIVTIQMVVPDYTNRDDNRIRHIVRELVGVLQKQVHFESLSIQGEFTPAHGDKIAYSFQEGRTATK